jgi:hypothetical protein
LKEIYGETKNQTKTGIVQARCSVLGYFGSICASDFGVMMPVISDQTVPIFTF